jgi:hypothetical protein
MSPSAHISSSVLSVDTGDALLQVTALTARIAVLEAVCHEAVHEASEHAAEVCALRKELHEMHYDTVEGMMNMYNDSMRAMRKEAAIQCEEVAAETQRWRSVVTKRLGVHELQLDAAAMSTVNVAPINFSPSPTSPLHGNTRLHAAASSMGSTARTYDRNNIDTLAPALRSRLAAPLADIDTLNLSSYPPVLTKMHDRDTRMSPPVVVRSTMTQPMTTTDAVHSNIRTSDASVKKRLAAMGLMRRSDAAKRAPLSAIQKLRVQASTRKAAALRAL